MAHVKILKPISRRVILKRFLTFKILKARRCWHLTQTPSFKITPCRLSATFYSVHLQLPVHPQREDALCRGDVPASSLSLKLSFRACTCKHSYMYTCLMFITNCHNRDNTELWQMQCNLQERQRLKPNGSQTDLNCIKEASINNRIPLICKTDDRPSFISKTIFKLLMTQTWELPYYNETWRLYKNYIFRDKNPSKFLDSCGSLGGK